MSIAFQCSCGKTIKADDANAGHTVRCPDCANLLTVPTITLDRDVAEVPRRDRSAPQPSEEEPFDVLEDDRALPMVERVRKRRQVRNKATGPRRRTIQDEWYEDRRIYFWGIHPLLWLGFPVMALVAFAACLLSCLLRSPIGFGLVVVFVICCGAGAAVVWLNQRT